MRGQRCGSAALGGLAAGAAQSACRRINDSMRAAADDSGIGINGWADSRMAIPIGGTAINAERLSTSAHWGGEGFCTFVVPARQFRY